VLRVSDLGSGILHFILATILYFLKEVIEEKKLCFY
jgi:hypothetical protein